MPNHVVVVGSNYGEQSTTVSQLLRGATRFWEEHAHGVDGRLLIVGDDMGKPATKQNIISSLRETCQSMGPDDQAAIVLIGKAEEDGTFLSTDYKTTGGVSCFEFRNCLATIPPTCKLSIICDYQHGGAILDLPFKLTAEKDPVNRYMQLRLDATSVPQPLPTSSVILLSTIPQHGGNSKVPLGGFMSAIVAALNLNKQPVMQQLLADVWHILSTSNSTGATDFVCMPRISAGFEFSASDIFTMFEKREVIHRPISTPTNATLMNVETHAALVPIQGSWITSTGTEVTVSDSYCIFIATGHKYPLDVDHSGIVSLMGSKLLGNPSSLSLTRLVWDDGDVWAKKGFAIPVIQNPSVSHVPHSTPARGVMNETKPLQQLNSKYDIFKMGINLLLNRAVRDTLRRTFEKFTFLVLMCRQYRRITNIGKALEKASLNLVASRYLHKWRLFFILKRPTQLPYKFRPVKSSRVGAPDRIAIWIHKGLQAKVNENSTIALYECLRSVRNEEIWKSVIAEYKSQFSEELEDVMSRQLEPQELEQCAAILLSNNVTIGTPVTEDVPDSDP